jgi:hypothetical protein
VAEATFEVPAQSVWAFRADFANLPDYNPDVSDVVRTRDGDESTLGTGACYAFQLADAGQTGTSHPVELWIEGMDEPTMVAAGMNGGNEAYEEFVVVPTADGCHATLTLWVSLPDHLPPETRIRAAEGGRAQIQKELDLMKVVLEGKTGLRTVQ